jgi:hypothetical protein
MTSTTRDNHYVPIRYQKRFIRASSSTYHFWTLISRGPSLLMGASPSNQQFRRKLPRVASGPEICTRPILAAPSMMRWKDSYSARSMTWVRRLCHAGASMPIRFGKPPLTPGARTMSDAGRLWSSAVGAQMSGGRYSLGRQRMRAGLSVVCPKGLEDRLSTSAPTRWRRERNGKLPIRDVTVGREKGWRPAMAAEIGLHASQQTSSSSSGIVPSARACRLPKYLLTYDTLTPPKGN